MRVKNIYGLTEQRNVFVAFPMMDGSLVKAKLEYFTSTDNNKWMMQLFTPSDNPVKYFFEDV